LEFVGWNLLGDHLLLVMKRSAMHWLYLGGNGDWLLLGGKKISHKWMAIFRISLSWLGNKVLGGY